MFPVFYFKELGYIHFLEILSVVEELEVRSLGPIIGEGMLQEAASLRFT